MSVWIPLIHLYCFYFNWQLIVSSMCRSCSVLWANSQMGCALIVDLYKSPLPMSDLLTVCVCVCVCVFWPHLVLQLADTGGSLWGWIVCVRNRDEIWGEAETKIKSHPKCVWTFFYRLYFSKRGQGFSIKWTSCQLSSSLTWPRQDPRLSFVFLFDLSRQ